MHKKDPKLIYNLLPEAIGRMSQSDETYLGAKIGENSFETFAKNFMPYLEKEKFSESLVEKLLQKFSNDNEKE